jgi:predicted metal-dependent hydrolase
MTTHRYCPARSLPPYTYVPGLTPHPISDPKGHSFGHTPQPPQPLTHDNFRTHPDYLYALDLFNHGFYWEAHEAWESLWHAAHRHGPTADFLKGLIKLAAAGVKAKESNPAGTRRHATRAAQLFQSVQSASSNPNYLGLSLNDLLSAAQQLAESQNPLDSSERLPFFLHLLVAGEDN